MQQTCCGHVTLRRESYSRNGTDKNWFRTCFFVGLDNVNAYVHHAVDFFWASALFSPVVTERKAKNVQPMDEEKQKSLNFWADVHITLGYWFTRAHSRPVSQIWFVVQTSLPYRMTFWDWWYIIPSRSVIFLVKNGCNIHGPGFFSVRAVPRA